MNTKELKVEMMRHDETGKILAKALGISEVSFSFKINENGSAFTRPEIEIIAKRYNLTPERVVEIFLS